jgi:hypothetical protein
MRLPPLEGRSMTSRKRVKSLRVGRRLCPGPMSALGHKRTFCDAERCLLYPQKQTCAVQIAMSAMGHKRTLQCKRACPLYPRQTTAKADFRARSRLLYP